MNLEFRNFNERSEEQLADWQQNEKEEFIRFCKFVSEKTK